jgi:23S rRNA (pseudouridine1915-N3)-methyltransferase
MRRVSRSLLNPSRQRDSLTRQARTEPKACWKRDRGCLTLKIKLIVVGKGEPSYLALEEEYQKRAKAFPIELCEVKQFGDDQVARKREAEVILAKLPEKGQVILLDERGEALTSHAFAKRISDAQQRAVQNLTFVIGGASGFDPSVKERADQLISLSSMTLPHKMARLVLLEQLYRASSIIRGEPYHK